jgi:hypothetical protein
MYILPLLSRMPSIRAPIQAGPIQAGRPIRLRLHVARVIHTCGADARHASEVCRMNASPRVFSKAAQQPWMRYLFAR